ncbi:MAG: metallophosphoesterase [Pseudomonadota bacterium]
MKEKKQRVFIIGDIHGCLDMLKRLVDKIPWSPDSDSLVFLGDYVDRGENSKGVIDFILKLSQSAPSVHCLMGNHESIFLDFLTGRDVRTFLLNGGEETLNSYRSAAGTYEEPLISNEHVTFLKSLHPWLELDGYYVVHAGFRPHVDIQGQTLEDMTWIREPFLYSDYDFGKRVIFGHTPFTEPLVMENKIGLDTGAVYGNRLTCLELPSFRFHSVEA